VDRLPIRRRRLAIVTTCTALLFLGLAAAGLWLRGDMRRYADTAPDPAAPPRLVEIPRGRGFAATLAILEREGVVDDPLRFRLLARLLGADRRVQAGEYQLSAAMPPRRILELLASGKVFLHRVTVPEGFTLRQIARLVAERGLAAEEELLRAAADPALCRALGVPTPSLEGYLFPETYHFARGTPAPEILGAMTARFWTVFLPAWREQAQRLGLTVHGAVTLAAVIEKETGAAAERAIIASVFHNRLARGMRLETDPTVIYGLGEGFDGNLTRLHLETPHPYNTYLIQGLPPGPIASPGAKALEAVLFPAETDYLFFVARGDGSHQFSSSLPEHQAAVRRYQLVPRR
jgi:UPF0755 protein